MNILLYIGAVGFLLTGLINSKTSVASIPSSSIFYDHSAEEVKNYYSSLTNGIKGDNLLSALQPILKNNQKSLPKTEVGSSWKYFVLLDRDWVKDPLTDSEINDKNWKLTNVICRPLYEETFTFISTNSPGYSVNREHVFPKSHGFQDSSSYAPFAGTDLQNLHMGEANNNQQGHGDYPYGNVANKDSASKIKSVISGNVTGYTGLNSSGIKVYEPMDRDKGDIARSLFYMVARYHTYDSTVSNSPALKLVNSPKDISGSVYASETQNNPCEYGILSDLLKWNIQDPVDDYEIHRNNLVFNACQYNRNPFIDYPSWADIAFGNSSSGIDKSLAPRVIGGSENPPVLVKEETPTVVVDSETFIISNLIKSSDYYLVLSDGTKVKVTSSADDGKVILKDYRDSLLNKTIVGIIKIGDGITTTDSDTQELNIVYKEEPIELEKEVTPAAIYNKANNTFTNLVPSSEYILKFSDGTSFKANSDASGVISLNTYISSLRGKTLIGLVKAGDLLSTVDSDIQIFDIAYPSDFDPNNENKMDNTSLILICVSSAVFVCLVVGVIVTLVIRKKKIKK